MEALTLQRAIESWCTIFFHRFIALRVESVHGRYQNNPRKGGHFSIYNMYYGMLLETLALTRNHRRQCVIYGRNYIQWHEIERCRVLFTHELRFCLWNNDRELFYASGTLFVQRAIYR